jgi:multiple sugar transport system permease protein
MSGARTNHVSRTLIYMTLIVGALVMLLPLAWMLLTSLKSFDEVLASPPTWIPKKFRWENYREALTSFAFLGYFINSCMLATGNIVGTLVSCTLAAYAFARLRTRGSNIVFAMLLSTAMLPSQVTVIPLFSWFSHLGLVNTYGGIIVPALASIFGIFVVRQYALTIPDDMLEAARIDGASEFRIFRSIVVPVLRPIVITLAVFTSLAAWNDFMWPLIVLNDMDLYTLPVALASLSREHVQDNELMMAGAVLTTFPVLLVFLALQRYYIRGLTLGSVKE